MRAVKVKCGTFIQQAFEIDVDSYCDRAHEDYPTADGEKKALDLLEQELCDPEFADDGHRNNCAVNTSIALHVLGYDPVEWFEKFFDKVPSIEGVPDTMFLRHDVTAFKEHLERIWPYLDDWGSGEHIEDALAYTV